MEVVKDLINYEDLKKKYPFIIKPEEIFMDTYETQRTEIEIREKKKRQQEEERKLEEQRKKKRRRRKKTKKKKKEK